VFWPGRAYRFSMISAQNFPTPEPPKSIPLTDEQETAIAAAFVAAQLSLLEAITREAKSDSFDASRNIARLTHSLNGLRLAAGQAHGAMPFGGWIGYPPGEEGEP
jgi:hypothetical protein